MIWLPFVQHCTGMERGLKNERFALCAPSPARPAIVDEDESVWRAISPLWASMCLAEKGNIRAIVVWPDGQPDDAIKEEIMGFGISTFRTRGTHGNYGYGQMQSWEILRAT